MVQARPEGYIGKQYQEGFTGYFSSDVLFGVLSLEEGVTQDAGKQLLEKFKQGLIDAEITSLKTFETTVSSLILSLNFPVHVGLAVGMMYKEALYVKTVGDGQIFFRRGNSFNMLLAGDKCASGYLKQYDLALFTTTKVATVIGDTPDLQAFVDLSPPKDIIEKMHAQEYDEEERGFVALFVEFTAQIATSVIPMSSPVIPSAATVPTPQLPVTPPTSVPSAPVVRSSKLAPILAFIRSKGFVIAAILVLFAILAWSVVFGYQRRQAAQMQAEIKSSTEEIQSTLARAQDEAFVNMDGALALIAETKTQLDEVKKLVGDGHTDDITKITTLIQETEAKILKKEEKEYEEFYDLALESEDAQGDTLAKEDDTIAILDTAEKKIYTLDLSKKAVTQYVSSDVSGATRVALHRGDVYFLTPAGIYKFVSQSRTKQIIPADEWGDITDMEIYNGNIYLLDRGKDELYKYLVTEGGYSDKISYFGPGQSIDLVDATGFSIDGAIYVATKSDLFKYLSGAAESFSPTFPDAEPQFDDIYTDPDLTEVAVLDTHAGSVFILTKDGEYVRQMQSSIFAKATGMYIFDDTVQVLVGSKLYRVSLE